MLVAREPQQPVDLHEFHEQFLAVRAVGQWRDRAVHGDDARAGQRQAYPSGREGVAALKCLPQGFHQPLAAWQQAGQRLADHLLAADLEQHFARRIDGREPQFAVEGEHCGRKVVENAL